MYTHELGTGALMATQWSMQIDDDASKVSTHNPHAKRTGYVLRKLGGLNKLGNEITYFMRLLKNPIRASQKLLWGLW